MSANNGDGKELGQFTCSLPKISAVDGKYRLLCDINVSETARLTGDREKEGSDILDNLQSALEKSVGKENGLPAGTLVRRIMGRGLSVQMEGEHVRNESDTFRGRIIDSARSAGYEIKVSQHERF